MSPAAPAPPPDRALRREYREIWTTALLQIIQERSRDPRWQLAEGQASAAMAMPVDLAAHWEISGRLAGKVQIKLHREAARAWAQLMAPREAAAPPPPPLPSQPLDEAEREGVAELLRQLAERVAAGLADGGWGVVTIELRHLGPLRRNVEAADGEFPLRFTNPEAPPLEIDICPDADLRDQVRRGPRPEGEGAGAEPGGGQNVAKLDLLLDVELDVTLRFGGRQMLLHDVLELAPGSVLELDRHIDDPVELLVGGKIIAWGEVVVVDGNYGLRITRLVHRRERVAAMGAGQ